MDAIRHASRVRDVDGRVQNGDVHDHEKRVGEIDVDGKLHPVVRSAVVAVNADIRDPDIRVAEVPDAPLGKRGGTFSGEYSAAVMIATEVVFTPGI